jgi:hypothetical protein
VYFLKKQKKNLQKKEMKEKIEVKKEKNIVQMMVYQNY